MNKTKNNIKTELETGYTIKLQHHVIFWLVYFLFNTLRWGNLHNDFVYSLKTNFIGFPIHMVLCYINIYILMPKLVFKKKYLLYTIGIISSLFLMVVAKFYLTYFLVSTDIWPEGPEIIHEITLNYTIDMMIGELYVITFVTAIKITTDWITEQKRVADLEKLQLETELRFLRTQISPHFFFNTLNNIYSLSIEKSNKASASILKLSELMRYLLYETKQKRQSLVKEIVCLQNYLELERIRYGDALNINMNVSGDIENKEIAPMLLLTFVENAFKHGANKNIGEVEINIDFKVEGEFLFFMVSNPVPAVSNKNKIADISNGIGLNNVKKRLALGYKDDDFNLEITQGTERYVIELKIKV